MCQFKEICTSEYCDVCDCVNCEIPCNFDSKICVRDLIENSNERHKDLMNKLSK